MKKFILGILAIIMVFILCSCSKMDSMPKQEETKATRFAIVESFGNGCVIMDRETNVEYWMSTGSYNYGTLTMLVDKDGNPKIHNKQ